MSPFSKCTTSLKQCIKTLGDESEAGIRHLPIQEQDFIRCPCGQNIYLDLIKNSNSCDDGDEMLLCD